MLKISHLVAKFRFDTADNEQSEADMSMVFAILMNWR